MESGKRIAIISSYHEACGIAAYTERLEKEFQKYGHVDVLPLNTEVLKSNHVELLAMGDALIAEIAEKLKEYDYVNIQFEAGLFGWAPERIFKRVQVILKECKNVIFTFHSVNFNTPRLLKRQLFSIHFVRVLTQYFEAKRWPKLYDRLVKELVKIDNTPGRKASIIVHDSATQRFVSMIYHFEHIYAHPLGLTNALDRSIVRTEKEIEHFKLKYKIEPDEKTIGVFGFISEYKGHLTALKALRCLPSNYRLLIFGAQHPASVQAFVAVDPYIERILEYIEECNQDDIKAKNPKFSDRIMFIGDVDDTHFAQAMRCCDVIVLPYVEVNQMGSGIAAQAIENHARAILSNTKCFQQLKEYFPDCFSTFDIGNYLELAGKIENFEEKYDEAIEQALKRHNIEVNVQEYIEIFKR